MKKLLLLITFIIATNCVYAQKDSLSKAVEARSAAIGHTGNNEIKVNILYLVLGLPEISYERLIADNMGVGVSAMVSLLDDQEVRYALLSNYRLYFGNKKANGFFIEGNMGIVGEEHRTYYFAPENNGYYELKKSTQAYFGLGAAAGVKFLTRYGLLGEAYLGGGRLLGNGISEFYPRIGVTIGKRF